MRPTPKLITLGRRYILALLSTVILLCLLLLFWKNFQKPAQPRLMVFPANAVTLIHQTQFITQTNRGALLDRGKRFMDWEIAKYRGHDFPALSTTITLAGLVNLYNSVDTLSTSIMMPVEFFRLQARFPSDCLLTRAPTSLRTFRPAVEEALCYNGIVGIQEGTLLRLVKSKWLRTNSNLMPTPNAGLIFEPGATSNAAPPHR